MKKRHKLGRMLLDLNIINQKELDAALERQKRHGNRLGATLLAMNLITEEDLEQLLSRQLNVPSINLNNYYPDPALFDILSEQVIKKYQVLPISIENRTLTIATADPRDLSLLDDIAYITGKKIAPVVVSITSLENRIRELFEKPVNWEDALKVNEDSDLEIIKTDHNILEEDLEKALQSAEETVVVKLVNAVILAAIEQDATHIHIEPQEDMFEIFLRIDGRMKLLVKPPHHLQQNVINRFKILGSIDILKRFNPAEGYFRARAEGRYFDLDIATMPSSFGERMVLTFQQPFSKEELKLEKLGFASEDLRTFTKLLNSSKGFIMVTGPTDSGKSSTIYAALNHIKSPHKSVFTFERTIKNKLTGIVQGQPNEKAGFSYEKGLQALLRQDIDVLMIGELLTRESIVSALLASLSNTLVLGRFLSNDSIGALSMLLDMDVPPFMLFSSLTAIIGQRLVRRLCQNCIEDYEPPYELQKELSAITGKKSPRLYKSTGCPACGHTGYNRRIGIFEIIEPSKELREAIFARATIEELRLVAEKDRASSLRRDALIKAAEGLTSYEEVLTAL